MSLHIESTRFVSFASAGTRGVIYMGAIDALEDGLSRERFEAWRSSLLGVAGTSAGALAALVLVLGLDREARRQGVEEFADVAKVVQPRPHVASTTGCEGGEGVREISGSWSSAA